MGQKKKQSTRSRLSYYLTLDHLAKLLTLIAVGYLLYYVWWRATQTMNPAAMLFSWALLLAEAFGVVNYILFLWMTWYADKPFERKKAPPGLKVDVFVPTYNEELEVLEATLVGCTGIRYPHNTYVLDDGHRPEVRELAERMGVEYISRPDNKHAKAGNINYALERTEGRFIAILDADMVPQPEFLDRTLGYFEDPTLAFVQMPQEFFNRDDSIQHDRKRQSWHEQSLFFRVIQPGKNHSNSAFWTGSPSVVRRAALESVGGVATETITEDIHTSVRLHAHGWRSFFLNEALAYGIAPHTIHAYLLQRLRWAQGTMQLYRSEDSPLRIKGLSLRQRLSYIASFLAYVEAHQKFFLIATPSLIILLEVFPMSVGAWDFFLHWAPYFLLTLIVNVISGRGYFNYLQTEKYNMLKMITFLQSFLILAWPKQLTFKVTPKSVENDVYRQERWSLRAYMLLLGGILFISLSGYFRLQEANASSLGIGELAIALFWATMNAGVIFLGADNVLRRRHDRHYYRFPYEAKGVIFDTKANTMLGIEIRDVALYGAKLIVPEELVPESADDLSLVFETPKGEYLSVPLEALHARQRKGANRVVGVEFGPVAASDRRLLYELLYVTFPARMPDRGYTPQLADPAVETPIEERIARWYGRSSKPISVNG